MGYLAAALLCLVLVQDVKFDAWKHLKGFDEAFASRHSELYDLARFEKLDGKRIGEDRLKQIRTEWETEKARVAKQISGLKGNLKESFLFDLEQLLKKDRFFRSITFERRVNEGEVILLVQNPQKQQKGYADRVEVLFRPHIEALVDQFRREYVEPLKLERNIESPFIVIFSLKSRGAYDDYARSLPRGRPMDNVLAHYDPVNRIAVTYEAGTARDAPNPRQRQTVLGHEVVHALLHSYTAPGTGMVSIWLNEGLAEYWENWLGYHKTGSLEFHTTPTERLRSWLYHRSSDASSITLPPIRDLVGSKSYEDAMQSAVRRAEAAGFAGMANLGELAMDGLYTASSMFVYFLHEGASEEVRSGFQQYLRSELQGQRGVQRFAELVSEDLDRLETEFLTWVDAKVREKLFRGAAPPAPSEKSAEPATETARPTELQLPPITADETAGLVLVEIRQGKIAESLARVDTSGDQIDGDTRAFLKSVSAFADSVLAAIKAGQGYLRVGASKPVVGKLLRYDERELVLKPSRGAEIELPRSAFDAEMILRYAKKMKVRDPLVEASLYLLGGMSPEVAARKAGLSSPDGALTERAANWSRRLLEGEAREELERLVNATRAGAGDAEDRLADARHLLGELRETACVSAHAELIRQAAAVHLGRQFDLKGTESGCFAVTPVSMDGGRIELSYDFADSGQLKDFRSGIKLNEFVGYAAPLSGLAADWGVDAGNLYVSGDLELAHVARFTGPVQVEFKQKFAENATGMSIFAMFTQAEPDGSCAGVVNHSILNAFDAVRRMPRQQEANPPLSISRGIEYTVRVEQGKSTLTLDVGGRRMAELAVQENSIGSPTLINRGPGRNHVSKIVIRGKLHSSFLVERRKAWIAEGLKKLDLPG